MDREGVMLRWFRPGQRPLTAEAAPQQVVHTRLVVLPLDGTFDAANAEPIHITGSIRVRVVTQTRPGGGGAAQIVSTL
ncbi:hypothetical protein [Streptomyces spiralis]|uniref:hypothetical protein n=1 Tax=Streptomyces spiralis TaxID=66376 RepID=UPI001675EABA|nr:hypothetical protein [Streptomyces spiralis]